MTDPDQPAVPRPEDEIGDNDREVVIHRVQRAVVADQLPFDQLDDRLDAVYRAGTRAELEAVAADLAPLPAPRPTAPSLGGGHPLPSTGFSLVGDLEIGGWVEVDRDLVYSSVLGDTTIDLSSAALPDELTVTTRSGFGDVTVIVPDGVRASVEVMQLIGDRKVDLADPRPGAPVVRVQATQLVGDVKLFSLSRVPEGPFRRLWKRLRA